MYTRENWPGENAFMSFIDGKDFDDKTIGLIKDCFRMYYGTEKWRGIIEWLLHILFGH